MISKEDWITFNSAATALVQAKECERKVLDEDLRGEAARNELAMRDSYEQEAQLRWNEIRFWSTDPRAKSIAKTLCGNLMMRPYAKPLKRWSGGPRDAKGLGYYLDYPDVGGPV